MLVAKGVAKGDASEGRAAARVVDDVGDHALEIAIALAEVEAAETSRALAMVGMGSENRPRSLPQLTSHRSQIRRRPSV